MSLLSSVFFTPLGFSLLISMYSKYTDEKKSSINLPYEAAASLVDAACPALPGDALEVVMAYCRWSDFFAHD